MFFETPKNLDFAGYADNNTPYTCSSNIQQVLENLQGALEQLFQWFSPNHFVVNAGKCHLLSSFKITNNIAISNTISVAVKHHRENKHFGCIFCNERILGENTS